MQCPSCFRFVCSDCAAEESVPYVYGMSDVPVKFCLPCLPRRSKEFALWRDLVPKARAQISSMMEVPMTSSMKSLLTYMNTSSSPYVAYPTITWPGVNDSDVHNHQYLSLALYPHGDIVMSVPTHPQAEPIQSILMHPVTLNKYWFCSSNVNSVDVLIALPKASSVHAITLHVDCLGYNVDDLIDIKISAGTTISNFVQVVCLNTEILLILG